MQLFNETDMAQSQHLIYLHPATVTPDTTKVIKDTIPSLVYVKSAICKKDTLPLPVFILNADSLLKEKRLFTSDDSLVYLKSQTLGISGSPRIINSATSLGFSAILILSLLLTTCAYSLQAGYFTRILKGLFSKKGNPDFFMETTLSGFRFKTCLFFQTILLEGLIAFDLIRKYVFEQNITPNHTFKLGIFLGIILIYHLFRSLLFSLLGNIFTTKSTSRLFISEYYTIMSLWGTWLFPCTLLITLYPLSPAILVALLAVPGLFLRIITFLKGIKIFFRETNGIFYIFLYLCALEILPFIALLQALIVAYTIN